jgi:3-dehydroquinate synthase
MKKIEVNIKGNPYPILIERGLRASVGRLLKTYLSEGGDAAVVTNPTVGAHYTDVVIQSIEAAKISCHVAEVQDGEQYKTLATISDLYDQFLSFGLDRKSLVVALGGGVVGDMTGFAAATYLRGIPFVQMPTTLLSMVDASVGGKTGVDLPQGKNLVGAFNQPKMVLIDPEVLDTLERAELSAGMAEVIKHGLIGNAALFDRLESSAPSDFEDLVCDAVQVKVAVVSRDPLEQGERALLNLGHTFGHAFELVSNYDIKHGVAVGVGLVAAARMGVELGDCDPSLVSRIKRALKQQNLPSSLMGYAVQDVVNAMKHDKKRAKKHHRFIVPIAPGRCEIREDPPLDVIIRSVEEVLTPGDA